MPRGWNSACMTIGTRRESGRILVTEQTAFVWHCYIPGLQPGQLYGYRVYGPWDPSAGLRFNPAKLLIDPYAQADQRHTSTGTRPIFPYRMGGDNADLHIDRRDSAAGMPKCVVVNPYFDWEHDHPPQNSARRLRHLRDARARIQQTRSRHSRAPARHLCWHSPVPLRSITSRS